MNVHDRQILVSADNLGKTYKVRLRPWSSPLPLHAVTDVDLQLWTGQTVAVVGESGSGKTTIARMILRLETPTTGTVRYRGDDISKMSGTRLRQHRKRVQAVMQNPWSSLDPRMPVWESISEPLVAQGGHSRRDLRAEVREVMASVGLDPNTANNLPHHFSGGQRQRIAVARALMPRPELIVLDEPLSALDVSVRAQVMNLLKDVQQETGVAFLMITHDLSTVRYLADQIVVVYLGRIVESGPADTVIMSPRHPYTRALVTAAAVHGERDETVLSDDVPSPISPPSGCAFHTRCWLYEQLGRPEQCRAVRPELTAARVPDHSAACHYSEKVPAVTAAGQAAGTAG